MIIVNAFNNYNIFVLLAMLNFLYYGIINAIIVK
jgi:hypothetical protein